MKKTLRILLFTLMAMIISCSTASDYNSSKLSDLAPRQAFNTCLACHAPSSRMTLGTPNEGPSFVQMINRTSIEGLIQELREPSVFQRHLSYNLQDDQNLKSDHFIDSLRYYLFRRYCNQPGSLEIKPDACY